MNVFIQQNWGGNVERLAQIFEHVKKCGGVFVHFNCFAFDDALVFVYLSPNLNHGNILTQTKEKINDLLALMKCSNKNNSFDLIFCFLYDIDMNNNVSMEYLDNYDIIKVQNAVDKQMLDLKVAQLFKPKMKVFIKVCAPDMSGPDMGKSTHPSIVRAVVKALTEFGVKCVLADSPYGKYNFQNLDAVYLNTGMLEVANLTTCELNRDLKTTTHETPNGVKAKSIELLKIATDCDAIVTIGKAKIDSRLGYFGAVANLFGLVPGDLKSIVLNRLDTLKDFNNYVLDIYDVLKDKIVLNVVDGIVALEKGDSQRMLSCLAMSENIFALDLAIMNILGIKPANTILKQAEERDLFDGTKPLRQIGEGTLRFRVEDFGIGDFNELTPINEDLKASKSYFKKYQKRVDINGKRCKGCEVCSKICPTKAITMKIDANGELFANVDYKKCIYCNKCHTACPYKVVEIIEPKGYKKVSKEIENHNK